LPDTVKEQTGQKGRNGLLHKNGDSVLSFTGWKDLSESPGKNVTRSQFKYEHIGVICSEGQV